jgi:hypothetical protein
LTFYFLRELLNGIAVTDENGNKLGHSKVTALGMSGYLIIQFLTVTQEQRNYIVPTPPFPQFLSFQKAAVKGITQVVISRITMAAPGMSTFQRFKEEGSCRV